MTDVTEFFETVNARVGDKGVIVGIGLKSAPQYPFTVSAVDPIMLDFGDEVQPLEAWENATQYMVDNYSPLPRFRAGMPGPLELDLLERSESEAKKFLSNAHGVPFSRYLEHMKAKGFGPGISKEAFSVYGGSVKWDMTIDMPDSTV